MNRPPIADLIVHDDDEEPEGDDFILGEDGRVHRGDVERHMDRDVMLMCCDAIPMRRLGTIEAELLLRDPRRHCLDCET